jgi:hypothetical protein
MPQEATDFPTAITFARTGAAEFLGSDGLIQSVAEDVAAFAYDATGGALGVVIEGETAHLLANTSDPHTILTTLTNATLDDDAAVAPDGTTTAVALIENTTVTAAHHVFGTFTSSPSISAGANRNWSFFVKPNGRTKIFAAMYDASAQSNSVSATIDLTAGTSIGAATGAGVLVAAPAPVAYPNGWLRVSLIGTPNPASSGALRPRVQLLSDGGSTNYTGNGTSGVYLWGHNVHAGASVRSFCAMAGSTRTRGADLLSVNNLGAVFGATSGTFKLEFIVPGAAPAGANRTILHMDDGSTDNSYDLRIDAGTRNVACVVRAGGAEVADVVAGVAVDGSRNVVAFSYTTDGFRISLNGAAAVSDISGAVPTGLNAMYLGSSDDAGSDPLDGILYGAERRRSSMGAADVAAFSAYPVE